MATDSKPPDLRRQISVEHWTDEIGRNDRCMSCGTEREANFCARCGQRHLHERLHFGGWLRGIAARVFQVDRGILFTFFNLLYRPGFVAREYVRGNQKTFVNPLTCFFLAAAAQILTLWLVQEIIIESIEEKLGSQLLRTLPEEDVTKIEAKLGGDLGEEIAKAYLTAMQQAYSYAALLFFAIPWAISTRFLHAFRGEKFRLGETTVWALYTVSGMLLVTATTAQIAMRINMNLHSVVAMAVFFYYVAISHRPFFGPGWVARIVTWICFFGSLLSFFCSIITIFIASVVWRLM